MKKIAIGELYQNNHHKDSQKRDFSIRWFELDAGYFFSALLLKLNIIQVNKTKL